MWTLQPETPADEPLIEALMALCFGPGRYAKTAYRLREGVDAAPGLSFVAYEEGVLRGSVRFWPIRIGAAPALMLGPLAVEPVQRGRGIGISLMEEGLKAAAAAGHRIVILVGDLSYYSRVGFGPVAPGQIVMPGPVDPRRLLARELVPGALGETSGPVFRAGLDHPIAAASTILVAPSSAPLEAPGEEQSA